MIKRIFKIIETYFMFVVCLPIDLFLFFIFIIYFIPDLIYNGIPEEEIILLVSINFLLMILFFLILTYVGWNIIIESKRNKENE